MRLFAIPDSGFAFSHWKGDGAGSTANPLVIGVSTDLRTWTETRRIEPFTGTYRLEVTASPAAAQFFRARIIP